MLGAVLCLGIVLSVMSCGSAGPFPAAPPLTAVPTVPGVPKPAAVPPFASRVRPVVPGLPGYNNPYYNQYNGASGPAVPILSYSHEQTPDGSYAFSYSTADGKQAQETGFLKDAYIDSAGEPQGVQIVQGSYAYISPEGTPIQVNYVADENGFRPSGVHIPANGKSIVSLVDKDKPIVDPYHRYDSNNYRNRFFPGRYNNNIKPYDPRYPYDAAKYNSYNPYLASNQNLLLNPKIIPAVTNGPTL